MRLLAQLLDPGLRLLLDLLLRELHPDLLFHLVEGLHVALAPLAADLAKADAPLVAEPAWGGTDVGPLRALGVPIFDLRQDASGYFDVHHTANDVPARLDPAGLAKTTRAIELVLEHVAGTRVDLGRVPEGEREPKH